LSWATAYIDCLKAGETVSFRPRGHSMTGIINNGDLVTVRPISEEDSLQKGDVVLCKVRGSQYLHLVKAVQGERYLIGNNRGGTNGWITRSGIFGLWVKGA
jgi:SOS-response transcriptional repressor LexA